MPERQLGEVPEAAVEGQTWTLYVCPECDHRDIWKGTLSTTIRCPWESVRHGRVEIPPVPVAPVQSPALGDQRLVPLVAVLAAVERWQTGTDEFKNAAEFGDVHAYLARTFGGEPDER